MSYTLEQLKAMNDKELYAAWLDGHFPFDRALGCRLCLTQHAYYGEGYTGEEGRSCEHRAVIAQVRGVDERFTGPWYRVGVSVLREHLEELYALRLFFDSLYQERAQATALLPASGEIPASQDVLVG